MKIRSCKDCPLYIYSITLGSMDKEVWHCRKGINFGDFDCLKSVRYPVQLTLNF